MSCAASAAATESHAHATALYLVAVHAAEGELRDAYQPGEATEVGDGGRDEPAHGGDDTPQTNLSISVLLVGLDNEASCPCRSVPFHFLLAELGGGIVVVTFRFKSGLRAGILLHLGQSRLALIQLDLEDLVLRDLDEHLLLEIATGLRYERIGGLHDLFVGRILRDAQFAVQRGAFQSEPARLLFLLLLHVPWQLLEGVGDCRGVQGGAGSRRSEEARRWHGAGWGEAIHADR
mmetsp:Transcript_4513/g.11854  ORF Transcript_4513/g.11854 Transcript_4513/m.11854 type:complete len:234 (+) Transcript_4513:329-1030(+)